MLGRWKTEAEPEPKGAAEHLYLLLSSPLYSPKLLERGLQQQPQAQAQGRGQHQGKAQQAPEGPQVRLLFGLYLRICRERFCFFFFPLPTFVR